MVFNIIHDLDNTCRNNLVHCWARTQYSNKRKAASCNLTVSHLSKATGPKLPKRLRRIREKLVPL